MRGLLGPGVRLCLGDRTGRSTRSNRRGAARTCSIYPRDIPRPALIQRMREFSFALGVRCQYCHTGGDGVSFDGVVFSSDEKPAKVKARAMLRMADQLNNTMLAQLPSRADSASERRLRHMPSRPAPAEIAANHVVRDRQPRRRPPPRWRNTGSFAAQRWPPARTTSANGRSTSWRGG